MYRFLYKYLFSLIDPERMHTFGIFFLRYFGGFFRIFRFKAKECPVNFFGTTISNPIGIAAGFDKNGSAIKGLFSLGFGFVEIGTVTPNPQTGESMPRIFRIGNFGGIINKMGFPNAGSDIVLKNLQQFNKYKKNGQIVGVNIGRNKDSSEDDYLLLIEKFIDEADYIAINISSPNTDGLRDLLKESPLENFLLKVKHKRDSLSIKKPFFLKISPDIALEDLKYIYKIITATGIEGIIISNTTISRPNIDDNNIAKQGGLSGKFLKEKSLLLLKEFNKLNKAGIIVISVGGIETKQDVLERLQNGANFVQLYTSFIHSGPYFLSKLI